MQHREVKAGDIHVIHDFKFLNIEERDAYGPKAEDLDKICLVVEPYGFYALQSVEPKKWSPLSTVTVSLNDFEVYTKEQTNTLLNKKIETYNISSSEFKCEYTRNGKEVFGIEIDCGALPNNTTKIIQIPNYNENNKYWLGKGNYAEQETTAGAVITLPRADARKINYCIDIVIQKKVGISIVTKTDYSSYNAKIVLNYTKG